MKIEIITGFTLAREPASGKVVKLTPESGPIDWLSEDVMFSLVKRGAAKFVDAPGERGAVAPEETPPAREKPAAKQAKPRGKAKQATETPAPTAAEKSLDDMGLEELIATAEAMGIAPEVYEDVRDSEADMREVIADARAGQ